ncbi:Thymidine kinase, cytosolic [Anabarilius grahami]|uniref:Thymidine kinase n=1 Tax=Anabarilius grahami TaxID=495550 RepID=A0A3N0YBX3_ANAGA|nr:Thymidine kinase, cytosolic [Anabarilius grahami]
MLIGREDRDATATINSQTGSGGMFKSCCYFRTDVLRKKPFGNILNLVPLAESVVKLNAVCMQCFKEASYTKRLGAEKEVRTETAELTSGHTPSDSSGSDTRSTLTAEAVEVIGGADMYHAACRACYGGLTECKENRDPLREETPPHVTSGKPLDQSVPRKLFTSLHL